MGIRRSGLCAVVLVFLAGPCAQADGDKLCLVAPAGETLEKVKRLAPELLARIEAIGHEGVTAAATSTNGTSRLELTAKSGFTEDTTREILGVAGVPAADPRIRIDFRLETDEERAKWKFPDAPKGAEWIQVVDFRLDPRSLDKGRFAWKRLVHKEPVLGKDDFRFARLDLKSLTQRLGPDAASRKDLTCCALTEAGVRKLGRLLGSGELLGLLVLDGPRSDGTHVGFPHGGTLEMSALHEEGVPRWVYAQAKPPSTARSEVGLGVARILIDHPLPFALARAPEVVR